MAKKTKKSQAAEKKFFFMNVEFKGKESIIQVGESRDVKLKFKDEDTFIAVEKSKAPACAGERKRTILARTVHGTMSRDEYGIHIGFYFRHDEWQKNEALAELLESEAEMMGDHILEMEATCK